MALENNNATDNEQMVQSVRYQQNKEANLAAQTDEDLIEELADMIQVQSMQYSNPNLTSTFQDIANQLISNKSMMARMPAEEAGPGYPLGNEQVPPQEAGLGAAALQAEGGLPPGPPPGPGQF